VVQVFDVSDRQNYNSQCLHVSLGEYCTISVWWTGQ